MLPSQWNDCIGPKQLSFDVAKQYATAETGRDEVSRAASVLYGDTYHRPFTSNSLSVYGATKSMAI